MLGSINATITKSDSKSIEALSLENGRAICYRIIKRTFDIFFSLIGIPFLILITIPVAISIVIEDGFPIFFIQERTGLYEKPFKMFKFRSMYKSSVNMHEDLLKDNDLDGPAFKMKNDPRVTKVGRILRRSSIDELPQLINILKGEMSFVGPRPLPTYETKECNEHQLQRYLIKPGLTCYWQCMGRNNIPFEEWMELDLRYLKEASVSTDLRILFKTFSAVIKRDGAF